MARLFWICLGGAIGTGARYLVSGWLLRIAGPELPYGTLAVSSIGSFLLCLLMQVGLSVEPLSPTLRVVLATGVIGGFTTYSTFNYETLELFQKGAWLLGLANLGITVVACLAAGSLGIVAGRAFQVTRKASRTIARPFPASGEAFRMVRKASARTGKAFRTIGKDSR